MIKRLATVLCVFLVLSVLIDSSCVNTNPSIVSTPTVNLLYEADLTQKDPSQTDVQIMNSVLNKIKQRISAFGIKKPIIQIQGTNRILITITGVKDDTQINNISNLIGQVALLEFKEQQMDARGNVIKNANGNPVWIPSTAIGSDGSTLETLTGKYLKPNAAVTRDNLGKPEVSFEWNSEGAKLFGQITQRLLNKPLGIFLDNVLISAPTVQAVITDKGVINGVTLDEAKTLAIELNSGTLDVPLKIISQN